MIPNRLKHKFTLAALLLLGCLFISSANAKRILIYGDSLSAAYGMDVEQGWAHLLAENLGSEFTVLNASISGDTSAGGLARLPLTLEEFEPDLVILELGANDGLRGLPVTIMRDNLAEMIRLIKDTGAQIVLVGISLPASYGPRYIDQFRAVYPDLASEFGLPFIDFYRAEFFEIDGYIQEDGLHPTAVTQPIVRDLLLEFLTKSKLLD